jgi:hypothetical protein
VTLSPPGLAQAPGQPGDQAGEDADIEPTKTKPKSMLYFSWQARLSKATSFHRKHSEYRLLLIFAFYSTQDKPQSPGRSR